jgi:pimeloyl-ACP methyl ester carboxylesterase
MGGQRRTRFGSLSISFIGPAMLVVIAAVVPRPATAAPMIPKASWSACFGDLARRIGSVFINPGGLGGSGVEFALFAGQFVFTPEVRTRFDIVGFDPRGIARSTALRCFGNPRQWTPYFTPFAFPITAEEEAQWEAADHYLDDAGARLH